MKKKNRNKKLFLKLSPSVAATFFNYRCERFLAYYCLSDEGENRTEENARLTEEDGSTFSSRAGYHWENIVIDYLSKTYPVVISEKGWTSEKLMHAFLAKEPVCFIYQAEFFIHDFLSDASSACDFPNTKAYWSAIRPDFILVETDETKKTRTLSIIDIKLSKWPKMYQKMQIALYARFLCQFIKEYCRSEKNKSQTASWSILEHASFRDPEGYQVSVNLEFGFLCNCTPSLKELFTNDQSEENVSLKIKDYFNQISFMDTDFFLDEFLDIQIPTILKHVDEIQKGLKNLNLDAIYKELDFCIGSNCGSCGLCKKCILLGSENSDLRLYPYLSRRAQIFLKEKSGIFGTEILTIGGLKKFIDSDQEHRAILQENYSFRRLLFPKNFKTIETAFRIHKANTGYEPLEALTNTDETEIQDETILKNEKMASMQLPKAQDIALVITLHRSIDSEGRQMTFAYGISAYGNFSIAQVNSGLSSIFDETIFDSGKHHRIRVAETLTKEEDLADDFICSLHQILTAVDQYNQTHHEKLTLQGYVFQPFESENLQTMLYKKTEELATVHSVEAAELYERILDLLFWIQGDKIVTNLNSHPKHILEFPIVVMIREITQIYHIPAFVTIQLWNVSNALLGDTFADYHEETEHFCVPLSDVMSVQKIYDDAGHLREAESARNHLAKRLDIEGNILNRIQADQDNQTILCHVLRPFEIPKVSGVNNVRISKLLFESLNEFYQEYCQNRGLIMRNPASAIAAGKYMVVHLHYEDNQYAICSLKPEEFQIRLTCRPDESVNHFFSRKPRMMSLYVIPFVKMEEVLDALRTQSSFDDFDNQNNIYVASNLICTKKNRVKFTISTEFLKKIKLEEGKQEQRLILIEKPASLNRQRESDALLLLNKNPYHLSELLYPGHFYKKHSLTGKSGKQLLENHYGVIGERDFETSQGEAFCHVCDYNITLLQGPPGTGKTDFLARTILAISRLCAEEHRSLRILVSAFAHAAINNALKKIHEKAAQADLLDKISIYKDRSSADKRFQIDGILEIKQLYSVYKYEKEPKKTAWNDVFIEAEQEKKVVIVGAICWSAYLANPLFMEKKGDLPYFDLIVIDEASQVPVTQALMTMCYGRISDTHYLFVGDNHQLSPILRGNYYVDDRESDLYSSIFNFYLDENRTLEEPQNYALALYSNFRMNESLCNYSAEAIYNHQKQIPNPQHYRYSGADDYIKKQQLFFEADWRGLIKELDPEETEAIAEQILDPDYPMVLVCLNSEHPELMAATEVAMVSRLTLMFQRIMLKQDGSRYFDPEDFENSMGTFWGTKSSNENPAFGILSPYHEQIARLKEQIAKDMKELYGQEDIDKDDFLIGTVNKLQGQEREAVIVSYGVNDVEKALQQGEFIYDYRRLNVSLTRGKKKTILFLTNVLTSRPVEMLDSNNKDLLEGVSYMCGLKEYMNKNSANFASDSKKFTLQNGVKLEIYRKKFIAY